jgi:hypothetical protein
MKISLGILIIGSTPENKLHREIAGAVFTTSTLTTRNSINHAQAGKLTHHQIRASNLEIKETETLNQDRLPQATPDKISTRGL